MLQIVPLLLLYDTYFGVFTDSDLGGARDDYVGCNMALVDPDGAGPLSSQKEEVLLILIMLMIMMKM